MRFLGNIEAKTDPKGRAFLPATFRKILQAGGEERLVLRKDVFQPCLVLYPESVWNTQMDAMRNRLNRWNKQHQQVFRQFVNIFFVHKRHHALKIIMFHKHTPFVSARPGVCSGAGVL